MRLLIRAAFLLLILALASVTLATVPLPAPKSDAERTASTGRNLEVHVTPEMIHHSRINDALYVLDYLYGTAVLLLILATGWSARLRQLSYRWLRWPFTAGMVYFALLTVVTTVLEYPLSLTSGFLVPHAFGLSAQSFGAWMLDFGKEFLVNVAIGSLLAAGVLAGIRRVRRWWLVLWLGSIPLIVFAVLVTPLVIDPIFNRFEPLRDPVLRQALLDEASRAGIEGSRVYQVDKSKQTKTMNAYVTGIGPTRRIVLWDTLLAKLDREETLAVMGHEMGHYVLHHLWKGIAFGILVSFFGFYFGQKGYERGLSRWGARWKIAGPGDAASLPWLLVVSTLITFLLSPVSSGFSRHIEHQADIFGLELTHSNEAMASAFVKFAEDSKQDPRPPAFIEWWRYSHPSLGRRIDFVLSYKPWDKQVTTRRQSRRSELPREFLLPAAAGRRSTKWG